MILPGIIPRQPSDRTTIIANATMSLSVTMIISYDRLSYAMVVIVLDSMLETKWSAFHPGLAGGR